jgi:hypothetical protein
VETISLMSLTYFTWNMLLYIRGRCPIPQSNGVNERKNHTLTDLVNSMLDNVRLSKAWCVRLY